MTGFAPWQTAKTLALCYFAIGVLFALPIGLLSSVMPFLYACAALVFVPLGCWIYNKVAKVTGGIELAVTSETED